MMVNYLEKGIPIPDRVLTLGIHLNIAYATCLGGMSNSSFHAGDALLLRLFQVGSEQFSQSFAYQLSLVPMWYHGW